MTESQIQADILRVLGARPDMRLFRNHVGVAWQGKATPHYGGVLLPRARRVRCGLCPGSADLVGFVMRRGVAVFLAIEVKSPRGRPSKAQRDFLDTVNRMGGIAFVARSVNEAMQKLEEALENV